MDPFSWFESIPRVTRVWFVASLAVNIAVTLDLLVAHELELNLPRLVAGSNNNQLELWRLLTCFLYNGGEMHEFHVLLLIYSITVHSSLYEKNPHPVGSSRRGGQHPRQHNGQGLQRRSATPEADYLFCLLCCVTITVASYLLVAQYEDSVAYVLDAAWHISIPRPVIGPPLFARTLLTSVMYLWSRRNPRTRINLNMFPIPGRFLPWAYLAASIVLRDAHIHQVVHGIVVGHLYHVGIEMLPLTTPQILIHFTGEQQQQQGRNIVVNHPRQLTREELAERFRQEGATPAQVAAKMGQLDELRQIVAEQGVNVLTAKDHNDWQPLHEAVRGGHTDIVYYILDFAESVDVNARTTAGVGPTPLWIAEHFHGLDHPITKQLSELEAVRCGPNEDVQ